MRWIGLSLEILGLGAVIYWIAASRSGGVFLVAAIAVAALGSFLFLRSYRRDP